MEKKNLTLHRKQTLKLNPITPSPFSSHWIYTYVSGYVQVLLLYVEVLQQQAKYSRPNFSYKYSLDIFFPPFSHPFP